MRVAHSWTHDGVFPDLHPDFRGDEGKILGFRFGCSFRVCLLSLGLLGVLEACVRNEEVEEVDVWLLHVTRLSFGL